MTSVGIDATNDLCFLFVNTKCRRRLFNKSHVLLEKPLRYWWRLWHLVDRLPSKATSHAGFAAIIRNPSLPILLLDSLLLLLRFILRPVWLTPCVEGSVLVGIVIRASWV